MSTTFVKNFQIPLIEASALFFVFPEYNGSIPGALKMYLDYLSWKDFKADTPVGLIGISAGQFGARIPMTHLQEVLEHRLAMVVPTSRVNIPLVDNALENNLEDYTARIFRAVTSLAGPLKN